MLMFKHHQLRMRLKRCEEELKNQKCIIDAKDAEMDSLRCVLCAVDKNLILNSFGVTFSGFSAMLIFDSYACVDSLVLVD